MKTRFRSRRFRKPRPSGVPYHVNGLASKVAPLECLLSESNCAILAQEEQRDCFMCELSVDGSRYPGHASQNSGNSRAGFVE